MREEHRRPMADQPATSQYSPQSLRVSLSNFAARSAAGLTRNRHMQASVRFSDLKERWAALRWQSGQDEQHQQVSPRRWVLFASRS